jgi:hypothetical protein
MGSKKVCGKDVYKPKETHVVASADRTALPTLKLSYFTNFRIK